MSDAGADGAVLQRGGVVVELDQAREAPCATRPAAPRSRAAPSGVEVGGDAARHDPVHHQPVAEAGVGGAQHALAQHAAMRVHEREGGVVADGADIAEMIGQPLQLGHQRAQPDGARRRLDCRARPRRRARRRGHRRPCCRRRCGRRACAARSSVAPCHQPLDALVDIAEPLLQPHHGLAIGGEAEMAGLDDAGMHRPDRDLVQALALGRQEGDRRGLRPALAAPSGARHPSGRGRARAACRAAVAARGRTGRGWRARAAAPADAARRPRDSGRPGSRG